MNLFWSCVVLTCEDLGLVEDAVVTGVGHEDVGRVLLARPGVLPHQGDFVAVLDDAHLVDSWSHRQLLLWDLVVVGVGLKMKRRSQEVNELRDWTPSSRRRVLTNVTASNQMRSSEQQSRLLLLVKLKVGIQKRLSP